jgi:putative DNA primase/helicase
MRQDFFDFVPQFKLWIIGNHKPHLDNVDEAMRRRMLLVPFSVQIPPEERDPDLFEKLKTEWPAILCWMIDGCLEWQARGLSPPQIVTDATDQYFNDQDAIGEWLEDCTEAAAPTAFTAVGQLFSSWKIWSERRNFTPGSAKTLSETLADRGFVRKRVHGGIRGFAGIGIKPPSQDGE